MLGNLQQHLKDGKILMASQSHHTTPACNSFGLRKFWSGWPTDDAKTLRKTGDILAESSPSAEAFSLVRQDFTVVFTVLTFSMAYETRNGEKDCSRGHEGREAHQAALRGWVSPGGKEWYNAAPQKGAGSPRGFCCFLPSHSGGCLGGMPCAVDTYAGTPLPPCEGQFWAPAPADPGDSPPGDFGPGSVLELQPIPKPDPSP